MNNEIKILLTINLEGGTLIKGQKEVRKYYLTKKDLYPSQNFKGESGKKIIKSGKYTITPLIQSAATQRIKMTVDAYNYMTSAESPSWYFKKDWKNLSEEDRLKLHLARTCNHFNGKSFTYEVLE